MKSFIKKYRFTLILLLVFILLCILALKVKDVLVPDEGKATYGERLKDISKHPISDETYQKVSDEFEKEEKVTKVEHRLQGKILNYFLTIGDKVSVKDAKAIGDKLISLLDEDLLGYYSIQIYLLKEDEALNNFPMIGLKDPLSKTISWTKERDITVSEDEE
jgi:hypothetical protein